MPRIEIVRGDITKEAVDAIVNAANSTLGGGGGVDGAIHRKGGPEILAECMEIRRTKLPDGLPVGDAVATGGGNLAARWVIHTVGPVYAKSIDKSGLLASCHARSLAVADELGAETVSFPAISCGIFGYPITEAAPIAVRTVAEAATKVKVVRFVLFLADVFDAFLRARHEIVRPGTMS